MKNDYKGKREGKPLKISVPPTLLITAVSKVSDIRNAKTSDFKDEDDEIFLVGPGEFGLVGSELHQLYTERLIQKGGSSKQVVLPTSRLDFKSDYPHKVPRPDWQKAEGVYRWLGRSTGSKQNLIKSIHDISDGGLLVALSECLIARRLGALVEITKPVDLWEFCFGEGFHTFIVSCRRQDSSTLMSEWREYGVPYLFLGSVLPTPHLKVKWMDEGKEQYFECPTNELIQAWKKEGYWQ